ncbi:hypothetical protein ACJ73_02612 [Blastomyces percursus]|uniref:Uncharacterized protein n=1 Tax=Blastomyces percursus TaxID=1658174 RepID=A0A1J9REC1_9EURO|nr:hypothetical protein ACJ73_02612 [Blastomyces percursus]
MAKVVTKVRVSSSTDDKILEEIKNETGCDDCDSLIWSPLPKATRIDPPENTIAIVVDIVRSQGAIRIFENEGDLYVDGVGTEDAGYMVIIPWNTSWWFRVSGALQVGYAAGKNIAQ